MDGWFAMFALMDSGRTTQHGKSLSTVIYLFPLVLVSCFSWGAGQKRLHCIFLVLWLLYT